MAAGGWFDEVAWDIGLVGAVGVAGNVIGTNRAASFAASRAAVSVRSMKISASMAYSIHIAVTRQTSAYHSILKIFSAAGLDFLPTKKPRHRGAGAKF